MEWLKTFSSDYANAITAIVAIGVLVLTAITLHYLKREYSSKYRPYVFPVVHAEPIPGKPGCVVSIIPSNIGPHPCKAKLLQIRLHIGDETYETPDTKDWLLLAPKGVGIQMPAGHVNESGVFKIRERRYKKNRIELCFVLQTTSIEGKFGESKSFAYEIDVLGEKPQALFRPEWSKDE
jgi:hypothetical protein